MSVLYILTLLFSLLSVSLSLAPQDPCSIYEGCDECLYNADLLCGWCGVAGLCLSGNETGPANLTDCSDKFDPNNTYTGWEWHTSAVLYTNSTAGSFLNPDYIQVFLRPGIPLSITVNLTVPFIPPIDFYLLQDASFSMIPYVEAIRTLIPNLAVALLNLTANSPNVVGKDPVVFGMGAFLEKPISPFANWPEAFVYKTISPLDRNATILLSVLDDFLNTGLSRNYEHPENTLEGLLFAAVGGIKGEQYKVGWREGAFRIAFIVTDATAHVSGQGPSLLGITKPNNLDNIPDGFPPGSGEDYPSSDELKSVLVKTDVNPIIGAVGKVYPWFTEVVNGWGVGVAVQLTPDPNAIIEAILNGTAQVLSRAIFSVQEDDLNRLVSVSPNNGNNTRDGFVDPVTRGQTIAFNITLLAPLADYEQFGNSSDIVLKYVGFGSTVTIHVVTKINCTGCSANDSSLQADVCGECGGNGTFCIGCDGVISLSPLRFDVCGVCGGDGRSCLGCDGTPFGPSVDACGFCGGNGTVCAGCDGIPNSGKVSYCGICGGNPNCEQLTVALISLATIAAVGIALAIAALIFLLGAGFLMRRADRMMIEKESNLQQNPLYTEAKKKFDNPTFGR